MTCMRPGSWPVRAVTVAGLLLVLLVGWATPFPALATPTGVVPILGQQRLMGSGVLTWWGFRVYEARLWVGAAGLSPEQFQVNPFALEMIYARAFDGRAIADASADEIERLGKGNAGQRERWLESMTRIFPNVARGDRLVGIHRPGRGVSFLHNDRPIGAIDDPEFGIAFFSIWLDPRTRAPALRQAILAGANTTLATESGKSRP